MNRVFILGVPIDVITHEQAVYAILAFRTQGGKFHVMTPNPEMLVAAHRNAAFRELLNRTALNLPDGTGLLWAAQLKGVTLPERVTGTDVLMALCGETDAAVFLLGAAPGVADRAAQILQVTNPRLRVVGSYSGSPNESEVASIIDRINASGAEILFVAFGAPQQDLWIDRVLSKLTTVKVAMGVGGAFDFVTGKQKRAPAFLRSMGLEWLWRLIREPRRIKRIFNAVIVFPYLVRTADQN